MKYDNSIVSKIYDSNSARMLIGALLNDCTLLLSDKIKLDNEDFEPSLFHQVLYRCIRQLARRGSKIANSSDIYAVVKDKQEFLTILEDNNYIDAIQVLQDVSSSDNVMMYYNEVKRCSLLRDIASDGDNIEVWWDIENNTDKSVGLTVENILEQLEGKEIARKRKYAVSKVKEEYQAGTDFMKTKEQNKIAPLLGDSFQSPMLNEILRGMFGFVIRVAESGGGKSVLTMGDLCKQTCTEYWSDKDNKFIINTSRVGNSLMINTEMELREELDPLIIAWISGVDRSHIADGKYLEGEEDKVDYANKVLSESGLFIVDNPEFTSKSLKETMTDYVRNKNVKNILFDYIQNNGFIAKEISSETKVPQREDMILLALTDRIKQTQRNLKVGISSSVQTNGEENKGDYPMSNCLAGGKAQVRKTNATIVQKPPTKAELAVYEMIRVQPSFEHKHLELNSVSHIIKGRSSKFPKYIKVFQYADFGTGRTTDLACLDKFNSPIKIKGIIIENKELD